MYRSFLTCDDPKGVVECGTIRNYRNSSQKMEDRTKSWRTAKNLERETSLTNKTEKEKINPKGSTEKSREPSSTLQLMEVSRGAQRLNNMIDSWSMGLRYDRGSEDIAKDLLKGALDLQESLVMLRKFQEASWHMARLKNKQNEKAKTGRINMIARTHSNQLNDRSFSMRFQRTWHSADDSSGHCTEELKKVIKDSLVRHNLFPSTSTEGLDSASELPSTSSSQSSGVHTDRLSVSSFSSAASKKEGGPNLVAKLMGLEEFPSRPFPAATHKQLEGEKILNQKRPIFEIDVPKVRKNNPIAEKVDLERKKSLREIIETAHFKGLLKKTSVRVPKLQIHHFNDSRAKQYDDLPPIVLMKPRCTPYLESVKTHMPVPMEELPVRKLKSEAVPSKTIKHKEGSTKIGKKMEEEITKMVTQEEGAKHLKEDVKIDEEEIKSIKKVPNKVKLYSNVSHKSHVSETADKKAKVKILSRKSPEKEVSKPRVVARSHDQGESASTKLKPQSVSRINKYEIPTQQSTALNTISKTKARKINAPKDRRKNQMTKQRLAAESEAAKPVAEQFERGEEEKSIAVPWIADCTEIRTITTLADELPMEHGVDVSANEIAEECKQSQSSSVDIMPLKSETESDATPAEEAHDFANCSETESKANQEESALKYLLLISQSFIGHAEELLNLDVDCPMSLQKYETNEIANPVLYLDCANELTERKSLRESQMVHPLLLTCAGNSRLHISLGRLVEEISNAIENLKFYREISGEKLTVDSIYAMMERDIKCYGLINGIWDWGWKHGFSADEAEQVVNEVESLVLSELIEEVVINL